MPSFISCNHLGCSLATPGDSPSRYASLRSRPPRLSRGGSRSSITARAPQAPAADLSASRCRLCEPSPPRRALFAPALPDPPARSNVSSRLLSHGSSAPRVTKKGRNFFRARRQRRRASRSKATASTSSATYSRPESLQSPKPASLPSPSTSTIGGRVTETTVPIAVEVGCHLLYINDKAYTEAW
jgi:hypothetical protein